jgi:hypothetical protein
MNRTLKLYIALLGSLVLAQVAQAFYNPSTGRWISRDPKEERREHNLYAFVRNCPGDRIDILGLMGRSSSNPGGGTITVLVSGTKIDGFMHHERSLSSSITWTPPSGGDWARACSCKPCQRAEWHQEIQWNSGSWQNDDADPSFGEAVVPWDCIAPFGTGPSGPEYSSSSTQATSEDHPGVTALWEWELFASSYEVNLRTQIKCVSGRDAGKVYFTVEWGGAYGYDDTPGPFPIKIQSELSR